MQGHWIALAHAVEDMQGATPVDHEILGDDFDEIHRLRLVEKFASGDVPADDPHLRVRHKAIKKVTGDLEAMKFNTAIAALMEFVNEIGKGGATREDVVTLIKLAAFPI